MKEKDETKDLKEEIRALFLKYNEAHRLGVLFHTPDEFILSAIESLFKDLVKEKK